MNNAQHQGAARDGRLRAAPARAHRQPARRLRARDRAACGSCTATTTFSTPTRRAVARVADASPSDASRCVEELPRGPAARLGRLRASVARHDAASRQRGEVHARRAATSACACASSPTGDYELCVADTGPGVSPRSRRHGSSSLFTRSTARPRAQHGGVGVGLAIARRIARGLGGDVRFESPSNELIEGVRLPGAAFYLTVAPRAPDVVLMQKES